MSEADVSPSPWPGSGRSGREPAPAGAAPAGAGGDGVAAHRLVTRLFAVAVLAHLTSNLAFGSLTSASARGVVSVVAGAVAVACLLRPAVRPWRLALGPAVLLSAWVEAPLIGNHWVLAALLALAWTLTAWRSAPYAELARAGRLLLLAFYPLAALAKLNEGFFEPVTSCATFFTNQLLGSWGLPGLEPTGPLGTLPALATAGIELLIPLLLVVPRTRRLGVLVGIAFHGLLTLDLDQHFHDFTSVLLVLFLLFLDERSLATLERRWPVTRRCEPVLAVWLALLVVLAVGPGSRAALALLEVSGLVLWLPLLAWVLVQVARVGRGPSPVALRPAGLAAWLVLGLAVANGLAPYLELKTASGWNMYSNLTVVDGDSNHLLVRSGLPLRSVQAHLVTVLDTDDPGLAAYVGSGWALPEQTFRHHLAGRPDATVTYELDGEVRTATGAELGRALPLVAEKLLFFRAVDTSGAARCEVWWHPAR